MTDKRIRQRVTDRMLIRLTFDGAFQRSRIYGANVSDLKRKEFRNFMASELPRILLSIQKRKRYNDNDHGKMISKFSTNVTTRFSGILYKKKFRIGNAQKFLNLYWKVAWLLKKISIKPIHCPFDSIIMKRLPKNVRVPWTQFDTLDEYQKLVNAAKEIAGDSKSLAVWEMKLYWEDLNEKSKIS